MGAQLRALRRRAGLTGDELAGRVGMSQAKISKLETGQTTASIEDVARLASVLRASPEEAVALVDQARTLASQLRTWRAMRRLDLAGHQQRVRELEAAARLVRVFQPTMVPGLLQTAEYARQVFLRSGMGGSPADVAAAVQARLDRQAALFEPAKRFTFLLTEAALRLRFCPDAVMQVQVDRILALSSLENVTAGYLPATAELDVVPLNGFTIYDDRVVAVETITSELIHRDDRDVAVYIETFERLMATALVGPAASAALRALYAA
ncbi:MAG: helix-turn-helix domain-containing protein [Chloroflexota bacterium]